MRNVLWKGCLLITCLLVWIPQADATVEREPVKTKILLSFDDGPAIRVTDIILNELNRREIKAIFFLLTGPEKYIRWIPWGKTYTKAESAEGFETVIKEIESGHMIACHWGGSYESQLNTHPKSLLLRAYDSTGDGVIDKLSEKGNALESDLIHCRDTLNTALEKANQDAKDSDILIQNPESPSDILPP